MLTAKNISFSYNGAEGKKILDDISWEINPGDFIAIIGTSGSGKTTLVKHMNGLLKATSGELIFNGQNVYSRKFRISSLRKAVGLVFQYPEHQLFKQTVIEDVMYGPLNMGMTEEEARTSAEDSLKLVGIDCHLWEHHPMELSGGQKRRVAIAGILAMDPEILVLDEPAAGLDPETKHSVFNMIRSIQQQRNTAIVLVSHHMEDVAEYADQVWVMHEGRIAISGTPAEVFSRVEDLIAINIGIPQITEITYRMKKNGIPLDSVAITTEQAEELIMGLLGKEGGNA